MSDLEGNPIKAHLFMGGQDTNADVVLTFPARPGRIIRLTHMAASLSGGSSSIDITGLENNQTYSLDIGAVVGQFFFGGGIDGVHADENTALVVTLGDAGVGNTGKLNVAVVYDLPTKTAS